MQRWNSTFESEQRDPIEMEYNAAASWHFPKTGAPLSSSPSEKVKAALIPIS